MKKIFFSIACLGLFLTGVAHAATSQFATSQTTQIKDATVSNVIYGELKGKPDFYEINLTKATDLYAQIAVPAVKGVKPNFSLVLTKKDGTQKFMLSGADFDWKLTNDSLTKDQYYLGPNKDIPAAIGKYEIEMVAPGYNGKYILTVGKKDKSAIGSSLHQFSLGVKTNTFFGKSAVASLASPAGLMTLAEIIVPLAVIIWLILSITRRRKRIVIPSPEV